MRKLVMLNPIFIFDPQETGWIRKSDFDKFLGKSLGLVGLQGESMETVGQPWAGIIKITRKEEIPPIVMKDTATPVKEQLARATAKAKGGK